MPASATFSRKHELASFILNGLQFILKDQFPEKSAIERICVDVNGLKVINVYQPPTSQLPPTSIPAHANPFLYANADFNCKIADRGYANNSPDGVCFVNWTSKNALGLLYNSKDAPGFYSGRSNSRTNPDFIFMRLGQDNDKPYDMRVPEKFPRSQSRSSLITACKIVVTVPSEPYKQWNF